MNVSESECSSGSESGWTVYLGQSTLSATQCQRGKSGILNKNNVKEGEYQEDLSMVSDASSGPPNFQDEDYLNQNGYLYSSQQVSESEHKKKAKKNGKPTHKSHLDDTASSPFYGFSKKSLNLLDKQAPMHISQGTSGKQSKGKSATKKHYGFFYSGNPKEGHTLNSNFS